MKVRVLPILMLVLFVVFAIVCVSRGQRNDPPQNVPQSVAAKDDAPAAPAMSALVEEPANEPVSAPVSEPAEAAGTHTTVDAAWFNDAAFVGDSVTLKLSYYAAATGALGNAQFFASGSLGSASAMWDINEPLAVHPSYQGQTMLTEDCVAASGASKLFIMLGMNDIAVHGIEDSVQNLQTLLERILAKCPGIAIYVQSMTPMTAASNLTGDILNPDGIKQYNELLRQLCQNKGWNYVDVASVMYDEEGQYLRTDYCSDPDDMGVHFTEAGCQAWIDYLCSHSA